MRLSRRDAIRLGMFSAAIPIVSRLSEMKGRLMAVLPTVHLSPGDQVTVTGDQVLSVAGEGTTSVVVSSAPAPTPTPIPTPIPTPTPSPSLSSILGVDFASRPKSGDAWNRMLAASKNLKAVTLTDTGGSANGELLAAAFVAAALQDSALAGKVVSICKTALNGSHSRTLEQGRNLAPIAIALDSVGDHSLDSLLLRERDYKATEQGSVIDCHKKRPNNWGTVAGLARVAVDAHIGDTTDLSAAVKIHQGWLGDRSKYAGFSYGDTSWQANPSLPVGINPKNATKSGILIDGVLPDDQRRTKSFPTWYNENYVWQALGEVAATQFILNAAGYPDVFEWSDAAVTRAYARYAAHNFGCDGDDGWQYAAAALRGVTVSHVGFEPGKSFGWVDWLYLG